MDKLVLALAVLFSLNGYAQDFRKMNECLIENGLLKELTIDYNPATGDRTIVVNGVRKNFYDVYPQTGKDYAAGQKWYINSDTVLYKTKPYTKYGLPRILGPTEIEKAGIYKGVGVYIEKGITGTAEVIYIPVRQGCEFQPYQIGCKKATIEQANVTADAMELTATVTGTTGKVSYLWTSDLPIIKGQATQRITVNTKNKANDDVFKVSVEGMAGKTCIMANQEFAIENQQTRTSKWGAEERKAFMETCIRDSKLGTEKGTAYCSCMLEKIIKLHPDPLTVQQELKPESIMPMAKECLGIKN